MGNLGIHELKFIFEIKSLFLKFNFLCVSKIRRAASMK